MIQNSLIIIAVVAMTILVGFSTYASAGHGSQCYHLSGTERSQCFNAAFGGGNP